MRQITKEFPGVKALSQVTFAVAPGEIHALVGENGAGKSTLMKVLSGLYPSGSYSGSILLDGVEQHFATIKDSERTGIAIIYQELALVNQLSIAENIFLGSEITRGSGMIDWDETYRRAEALLAEVGLKLRPDTRIKDCGVGEQQLVEIAKALAKQARILILDEPTAALTEAEAENLLAIIKKLKARGVTCIYISHRLHEVMAIADRITVLRDGQTVATRDKQTLDEDALVRLMVGREIKGRYPRRKRPIGDVVLEVESWTVMGPHRDAPVCRDVSFVARRGEILGIAGLMGAGRSELVMSLFGVFGSVVKGELRLEGRAQRIKSARDAIAAGLGLVSEDRKRSGLVLGMDIKQNITLASLERISKLGLIDPNEEIHASSEQVRALSIKTPSLEQRVGNLSGGNQQKVVLAKWLRTRPKVLILDEPTRGIDVGAKYEIYNIMQQLAENGVTVIMVSSDLAEVLGMSDRILVMHEGRLAGELAAEGATQADVMHYATGGSSNKSSQGTFIDKGISIQ
jgi:D-xylose transport system ATP-binding protein